MQIFTICKLLDLFLKIAVNDIRFLGYSAFASFGTYFCMYAFRKPFTVATFENIAFIGIDYKILLIISQVLGYMLSKFIGIQLISELSPNRRLPYLLGMILLAEGCLIAFGVLSAPYNIIFMFLNGLSLGMIWGIVFSYLEGRKFTEILGVALCSSFIVSSGAVKSIGLVVLNLLQIAEIWMPAVTGALFLIPFACFAFLLERMPQPTAEDMTLRSKRDPMTRSDRKQLIRTFMFPLAILVFFYTCLTALRDFRDNFSREIWDAIGYEGDVSVYTLAEIPIAIVVLLALGAMSFIKNNKKAFLYYHYLLLFGVLIIGTNTFLYQMELVSPLVWMMVTGFGLYSCYVPFNGLFFDRMIAVFRIQGNVGFLIYVADAFGYLGSIGVLLYKNFGQGELSWVRFFINSTYLVALIGLVVGILSLVYFRSKYKKVQLPSEQQMRIV